MYNFVNRADVKIECVMHRTNAERQYRNKFREANSFVYYVSGGHIFEFDGETVTAGSGDIVVLPYGASYTNTLIDADTEYYQIEFNVYKGDSPQAVVSRPTVLKNILGENAQALFSGVYRNYTEVGNGKMLLCIADTLKILAMLQAYETTGKRKNSTEQILLYVKEHCCEEMTVKEIAETFHISVSLLEKRLRVDLGLSPIELKNSLKIEKAKQLLAEGCSIEDTAFKTGFSDRYYFTKMFRRFAKQTPLQFIRSISI